MVYQCKKEGRLNFSNDLLLFYYVNMCSLKALIKLNDISNNRFMNLVVCYMRNVFLSSITEP
jgi:hypothetical protein